MSVGAHRKVPGWDCKDGTPEEDHDWVLQCGDPSVGLGDYMECAQCGKEREATDSEISASYDDQEYSDLTRLNYDVDPNRND